MLRLFTNTKLQTTQPPLFMDKLNSAELEMTTQRLMALDHAQPFTQAEAHCIASFMFAVSALPGDDLLTPECLRETPHALLLLRGQAQLDLIDSFGKHPMEVVQEGAWIGLSCLFGARAEDLDYRAITPLRAAALTRNALDRLRATDAVIAARCGLMLAERLARVVGEANRRQRVTALIAQSLHEELADETYKHMKSDEVGRDFVHSRPSAAP